ncbi:MAG: VWA domain-containing protein [Verrucomicrobiae bacterium]|nr:VWA domain-containing protein [Verrucomicrobiae bacterium]
MSFTVGNLSLIPFLLAVGIPLLIHLFVRSKPPQYAFPSVEFLHRIVRRTMRVRKPRDWMLLALRTLLFLSVVLLFLKLIFFPKAQLADLGKAREVVILVDRSASMSYVEAGQTRFASACAEAAEVLDSLSGDERANVIWVDSQPDAVFPNLGANRAFLKDELIRAQAGSEACRPVEALRLADEMLDSKGEIWIVSDFQASDWTSVDAEISSEHTLFTIPIGAEEAGNLAITDIETGPAYPIAGEEVELRCTIANHSNQQKSTTVYLNAGIARQSKEVLIEAEASAAVTFVTTFDRAGEVPVRFSIDEDAFPGDNERTALLTIQDSMIIAVSEGNPDSAAVWKNVVAALPWATLRVIDLSPEAPSPPEDVQTIIMTGWDGNLSTNVKVFHDRGGTLLWSLDSQSQSADSQWEVSAVEKPFAFEVADPSAPPFKLFESGDYGDIAAAAIIARIAKPTVAADARVWLQFSDQTPALWNVPRTADRGILIGWNMPVTREYSNWQGRVEFLPLVGEILLASRPMLDGRLWEFTPGDLVSFQSRSLPVDSQLKLSRLNGDSVGSVSAEILSGSDTLFRADIQLEPGTYTWQDEQKSSIGYSVVNFPKSESNLAPASSEQLAALGSGDVVAIRGGNEAKMLKDGIPLWHWLLAAAMMVFLLVGLLEWSAERVQESLPKEGSV